MLKMDTDDIREAVITLVKSDLEGPALVAAATLQVGLWALDALDRIETQIMHVNINLEKVCGEMERVR